MSDTDFEDEPIEVVPLGACNLDLPIEFLWAENLVRNAWIRFGEGANVTAYSTAEAVQSLEYLRGERTIAPELWDFCGLTLTTDPRATTGATLDFAEVAVFENNSPFQIEYDGLALNRRAMEDRLLTPVRGLSAELNRCGVAWLNQGLYGCQETLRAETGATLAAAVTDDLPDAALARDVLRHARCVRSDLETQVAQIGALRDLLRVPLTLMTYVRFWTPDGRPMPWPMDFLKQTRQIAQRHNLMLFEPNELVRRLGAANCLQDDMIHYKREFAPTIGAALFEFLRNAVEWR